VQLEGAGEADAALRDELLTGLLTIPVVPEANWSDAEKQQELDNNARASWATWCAGSTRAWAAPRCPTSTTWA
jgi:malate synthase